MSIKSYTVGELQVNCYFIIDDKTRKTIIVDPGDEPEKLVFEIEKNRLKPHALINTHGHADHIGGNSYIKSKYNIPIYIHTQDKNSLTDAGINLSASMYFKKIVSPEPSKLLNDGDIIKLNEMELLIIHTPGHTPGSICMMLDKKYIFTGDTLFCSSVGRCDLPGGDEQILMDSLNKLKKLPGNLIILPGHGPECTIANELKHNPYL